MSIVARSVAVGAVSILGISRYADGAPAERHRREPRLEPLAVGAEVASRRPAAQAPRQQLAWRRAEGDHGAHAAVRAPRRPDRREAAQRSSRAARPPGACSRIRSHMRERVAHEARPERALRAPVAARVVGQRGHAAIARGAGEVEVALLRRARPVADHDARPSARPSGMNSAYARPSWVPSSGRAGRGCFIIGRDHGRERTHDHRRLARLPARLAPERARPARGRRLRRGRAGGASSAPRPTSTPRTTSAPAPASTWTPSAPAPSTSRSSTRARRSPARPPTGCWSRRACPATWRRGGELFLALNGGFPPERIYMHGNNKSDAEIEYAVEQGVGHIVADSFDELDRLERIAPGQKVLLRVTPGIKPETHAFISTGQEDSKFGFGVDEVPRAIERAGRLNLVRPARAHRLAGVRPRARTRSSPRCSPRWATTRCSTSAAASAWPTPRTRSRRRSRTTSTRCCDGAPEGVTRAVRAGPLAGRRTPGVTIYRVGTVKRIPGVRTYVAVDGGMSDNLRPMLYGARYEAEIADRFGGETLSHDRRQALRVGRHPRHATWCSTTPAPATCWSRRPRAHTVTRWPTTTTASRARP